MCVEAEPSVGRLRKAYFVSSMSWMPDNLREAFARLWTLLWRGRGGSFAVNADHEGETRRRVDVRARFWSEFRQGQREADARGSRRP